MNFIKKLFSKITKKSKDEVELIQANDNKPLFYQSEQFNIHQDIVNLLWIADGMKKNYETKEHTKTFEYHHENIKFNISFSTSSSEEPSLISLECPIAFEVDFETVESPSYFPVYADLNDKQKRVYWEFLKNPYDNTFNIGYVFILYYGLERHLLEGNLDTSFDVILKLRKVHKNSSFQSYSAEALILICFLYKRSDLIQKFYHSINEESESSFSHNLSLLCKMSLHIPLTSFDIIKMQKTFQFNKTNYTKKYPKLFIETLESVMKEKQNTNEIYLNHYISTEELYELPQKEMNIFANVSLNVRHTDIPLICEHIKLKEIIFDLLNETHERVKKHLAKLKKEGNLPPEDVVTNANKVEVILIFDKNQEQEYLAEYEKMKSDPIKLHFLLNDFHKFYYKYRELSDEYVEKCINICLEDIQLLPKLQKYHVEEEANWIITREVSQSNYFKGIIPSFKRLVIIYEKRKEFQSAIHICNDAIHYYTTYNLDCMENEILEWNNRINKLTKKLTK